LDLLKKFLTRCRKQETKLSKTLPKGFMAIGLEEELFDKTQEKRTKQ
jgi:hypothetical protein